MNIIVIDKQRLILSSVQWMRTIFQYKSNIKSKCYLKNKKEIIPSATKKKKAGVHSNAYLPSSGSRWFTLRLNKIPAIGLGVKCVQVVKVLIKNSIIATKYINQIIVDN